MKLYNLARSPYAARVRMQIRYKDLPIEICEPPFNLRTEQFRQAFPLGKIPLLDLGDGHVLAESTVIMNYLEALYPSPSLLPEGPLARAYNEILIRYADSHLNYGLLPLMQIFLRTSDAGGDVGAHFARLSTELKKLETLLGQADNFRNRGLLTGDICVATMIYYVIQLGHWFDQPQTLAYLPQVSDWWQWVNDNKAVFQSIHEMDSEHQAFVKSAKDRD